MCLPVAKSKPLMPSAEMHFQHSHSSIDWAVADDAIAGLEWAFNGQHRNIFSLEIFQPPVSTLVTDTLNTQEYDHGGDHEWNTNHFEDVFFLFSILIIASC